MLHADGLKDVVAWRTTGSREFRRQSMAQPVERVLRTQPLPIPRASHFHGEHGAVVAPSNEVERMPGVLAIVLWRDLAQRLDQDAEARCNQFNRLPFECFRSHTDELCTVRETLMPDTALGSGGGLSPPKSKRPSGRNGAVSSAS